MRLSNSLQSYSEIVKNVLKEVKGGVTLANGMGIDIEFVNELYFTKVEDYPSDAVLH